MTTVESVFASAMGLMDELDPQGGAQSADTKDYERRAPAILNALCAELRTLTGEGSDWLPASGTEDLLPVEENYGLSALPYGLAANLLVDENPAAARSCARCTWRGGARTWRTSSCSTAEWSRGTLRGGER